MLKVMEFHLILLQVRMHHIIFTPDVRAFYSSWTYDLDDILGDFDHDGIVEKKEIDQMRKKLHDLFDLNANGQMDPDEVRSLVDKENEMPSIYQKLDTNLDEKISASLVMKS